MMMMMTTKQELLILLPEKVARQSLIGRQCSAGEDVEDDVVDDLGACKPAQAAPLPGYGP